MIPNFLCVGTAKAGTTTLHDILSKHPDIYLPIVKETKYFVIGEQYSKGITYYEDTYFHGWTGEKAVGEIDPDYMYREYVPERIFNDLGPEVKLIFLLRHPVDRAYSHYLMNVRQGWDTLSFEDAIKDERQRLSTSFGRDAFSYMDRGFYSEQIGRFLKYFPRSQMKFIVFEEFVRDIAEYIRDLCLFLGVDYEKLANVNASTFKSNQSSESRSKFIRNFVHDQNFLRSLKLLGRVIFPTKQLRYRVMSSLDNLNLRPAKRALSPQLRDDLMKVYQEDVQHLRTMTGLDLSVWER